MLSYTMKGKSKATHKIMPNLHKSHYRYTNNLSNLINTAHICNIHI